MEAGLGIITKAGVIGAEVVKRKTVQVPAVGGIAEGTEIGVMWSGDKSVAAGDEQAVNFFHHADDVGDVFDDVDGADFAECIVAQGVREMIEIGDDVGAGVDAAIKADGAGKFIDAAANIENRMGGVRQVVF